MVKVDFSNLLGKKTKQVKNKTIKKKNKKIKTIKKNEVENNKLKNNKKEINLLKKEINKTKLNSSKTKPSIVNKPKIDFEKIKQEIDAELGKENNNNLEQELELFETKPKKVKEQESEGFDFNKITSQIKEKIKETEKKEPTIKKIKKAISKWKVERVPTGIQGLDELIEGGFEKGSSVLIVGSAGTGKTLFGLQFLYAGATQLNEPGIFISFEEERESLYRHSESFGWDFEELEKKNLFKVLQYKPHQVEKLMKEGGGTIKDQIKAMNAKRLVIDSITSYGLLFKDEYERRENILAFFDMLQKWGCTSIIISELPPKLAEVKEGSVGFLTDAIISLYYSKEEDKGVRVHSCEILKMRGTKHTNKLLAIAFEKNGIVIYPEVEVF